MNYLFDIGETGKPAKKRKKLTPEAPKAPAAKAATAVSEPSAAVGTLVPSAPCYRCGGNFADIVEQRGEVLLVQCAFCLAYDFADDATGKVAPGYVFSGGRFSGMTLAQVANDPVGISYLRWAAEKSPRDDERGAARMWLDQHCQDR